MEWSCNGYGWKGFQKLHILWWIHFDIWQNQYNIVKFKNKIKKKKKKTAHKGCLQSAKKSPENKECWLFISAQDCSIAVSVGGCEPEEKRLKSQGRHSVSSFQTSFQEIYANVLNLF